MSDGRVLRLITRLNIGGPAIQALMLTQELSERFPTVLGAGRSPREEGELYNPAVHVRRVPLVRAIRPHRDLQAYRDIGRLIRLLRPDIVHTHMAKAGSIGRLAASRSSLRPLTVHTFHGHVLEGGYFQPKVEQLFVAIERWLAARTDVLVAVSNEVRDSLLDLGIGRADQWRVIPLGFDLDPFLSVRGRDGSFRASLRIGDEAHLVGVVGRLAPIKDHRTLLEAIALLPSVHLAVVGDGELRSQLEARARAEDLAGRVHFVGWSRAIPVVMSDMDLVVLSSINEGTPVSLIEASACARPVVATDVGGVKSVVRQDETGVLVSARDPKALARELRQLLEDPERAGQMGAAGRTLVRDRFSKERLLRDVTLLYEELLENRSDRESSLRA